MTLCRSIPGHQWSLFGELTTSRPQPRVAEASVTCSPASFARRGDGTVDTICHFRLSPPSHSPFMGATGARAARKSYVYDRADNTRCQHHGPRVPGPFSPGQGAAASLRRQQGPRGPSRCRLTCTGETSFTGGSGRWKQAAQLTRRPRCHEILPETPRNNALKPYHLPQTSPHIDEGFLASVSLSRGKQANGLCPDNPGHPDPRSPRYRSWRALFSSA